MPLVLNVCSCVLISKAKCTEIEGFANLYLSMLLSVSAPTDFIDSQVKLLAKGINSISTLSNLYNALPADGIPATTRLLLLSKICRLVIASSSTTAEDKKQYLELLPEYFTLYSTPSEQAESIIEELTDLLFKAELYTPAHDFLALFTSSSSTSLQASSTKLQRKYLRLVLAAPNAFSFPAYPSAADLPEAQIISYLFAASETLPSELLAEMEPSLSEVALQTKRRSLQIAKLFAAEGRVGGRISYAEVGECVAGKAEEDEESIESWVIDGALSDLILQRIC